MRYSGGKGEGAESKGGGGVSETGRGRKSLPLPEADSFGGRLNQTFISRHLLTEGGRLLTQRPSRASDLDQSDAPVPHTVNRRDLRNGRTRAAGAAHV